MLGTSVTSHEACRNERSGAVASATMSRYCQLFHVPSMSANDHQRAAGARTADASTSMDVEPARLSMKASSAWNVNSMSDSSRPSARCWGSCWSASTWMCRRSRSANADTIGCSISHRLTYTAGGRGGEGQAQRCIGAHRGGAAGASGGDGRRALDPVGDASGELCGGADDAEGGSRRCCVMGNMAPSKTPWTALPKALSARWEGAV